MTRRQFAALAAAPLFSQRNAAATPFPVRFARANPFDAALRYVEPGSDEFKGEKAAIALEQRLQRIFAGSETAPPGLQSWLQRRESITAARFFALPHGRVRFEIQMREAPGLAYHTGLWQLPDFREISHDTTKSPKPYFRDVTTHVFGKTPSFQEQLLHGNPYWRARIDSASGIDVYGNQGIAVGDIDNDGVDEIYVCQPGGLPNRLYKIGPDGLAQDITERAGLAILDDTTSALFADFRNSGRQDLVVLRAAGPLLFLNEGDGRFVEQRDAFRFATNARGSFTGMAAADYDRDGRLDLYLCCYVYFQSEDQYQFPAPYHDARNGPPNFLFRNRAEGSGIVFEDVTAQTGMHHNNNRFSFAPAWCDFNGDGWPDLYVANDFGRNNLYVNHEGHFRDEAAEAGVEDLGPGMSASWFDYDLDGRPDVYTSNMWTAPGQRIVMDPAFAPAQKFPEAYRGHTMGNALYRNRGDGKFERTSSAEGVEMGRWAWGSGGFDFDLDGSPEIFITSGMITNSARSTDLNSFFWRQVVAKSPLTEMPAPAYENGWSAINQLIREDYNWAGHEPNVFYIRRDGRYRDASGISGLDFADDTRSFAVTDFDGDGRPDLILKSRLGPQVRAMQNGFAPAPSIGIRLRGTKSNRDGIGARVEVNGCVQWLAAGSGFLSQHSKTLLFGMAGKDRAAVSITWPSGAQQRLEQLEPGATYTITEDEPQAARQAFRQRQAYTTGVLNPKNSPEPAGAWLLQPVPLPEKQHGPGLLVLRADDLAKSKAEVAAGYAIFRRYLFEYRSGLDLPLAILLDGEGRARKIYAGIPSEAAVRSDLANLNHSATLALPFPGAYISEPQRNYYKIGAALYWAGYPDRALPYLEETVRSRPDNWKSLLAIARIRKELEQYREAIAAYERVLAVRANYAPAIVEAGECSVKLGDKSSAQGMFDRALKIDPSSADALNQLGLLAAQDNRFDQARKLFQQAIEAQPDHAGAINNLGVLYAKQGQQQNAIAAFRYGIEKNSDDETLYMNLGRMYISLGDRAQARSALLQLLDHKPDSKVGAKALADLDSR